MKPTQYPFFYDDKTRPAASEMSLECIGRFVVHFFIVSKYYIWLAVEGQDCGSSGAFDVPGARLSRAALPAVDAASRSGSGDHQMHPDLNRFEYLLGKGSWREAGPE